MSAGSENRTTINELLDFSTDQKGIDISGYLDGFAAAAGVHDLKAKLALLSSNLSDDQVETIRPFIAEREAGFAEGLSPNADRSQRLQQVRQYLEAQGLSGFIQPMTDEYQNEYIPVRAERITWLSGFTGSAGMMALLADRAVVLTDGRYTLQVAQQVDPDLFETRHISDAPLSEWLKQHMPARANIGFDPRLHTIAGERNLRSMIEAAGGELVPIQENPIDHCWQNDPSAPQPPAPLAPIVPHPETYSGEASEDKRSRIGKKVEKLGASHAVLNAPDSIAWLLNIRGGDVAHTPLPLSSVILRADGQVDLFFDQRKKSEGLENFLGNQIVLHDDASFNTALQDLAGTGASVLVDPNRLPYAIAEILTDAGATIIEAEDPIILEKAKKNDVEIAGTRSAHRRDGLAETRFLHWLATTGQDGNVDELDAQQALYNFRSEGENFRDLSFQTITGSGPNGAIVHYKVTSESNRPLEPGTLYLVDSGAQYLDGTTDITRTIAIGEPTDEMRDRFTRVLKGHIALARAVFPAGTTGTALDVLARGPLWEVGLDFDHGTGHGVGSYLGVHEGPQRISKAFGSAPLEPGMIISNEPGYYKTGEFGIRIENLVLVQEAPKAAGAERDMLCFETLTLAPIDLNLITVELLNASELHWLNQYHERVREALSTDLPDDVASWLANATRKIG